jgi:hypothetical protein
MFVPQTTFGPHLMRAPDGNFVLIFRVNVLVNATLCAGGGSDPLANATTLRDAFIRSDELVSGDPEKGTSIYVAWAPKFAGPWSVARVNITNGGEAIHKSNPSIAVLQKPINGKLYAMAYRYNPPGGGEMNAIALASDYRGPYTCLVNITGKAFEKGQNYEDPFVFQLPSQPGVAHILLHMRGRGLHNWGPLDGSGPWRTSPTNATAFSLAVPLTTGGQLLLSRRERPELRFGADGLPLALVNGVVGPDGTAFSFTQDVMQE